MNQFYKNDNMILTNKKIFGGKQKQPKQKKLIEHQ